MTTNVAILDTLLNGASVKIPTLPVVGLRIVETCRNENFSLGDLTPIISTDPNLTVKTLKLVNSPLYSLMAPVKSIDKAVGLLGMNAIKNIALSFVIIDEMNKDTHEGFDNKYFWKRSVTSAVAAEIISQRLGLNLEGAFVTALLMDIGIMVMHICQPEKFQQVLNMKKRSSNSLVEIETEVFGYDHQQVGRGLLKEWGLPKEIYIPIAYQHTLKNCPPEYPVLASALNIGDLTSAILHSDLSARRLQELTEVLTEQYDFDIENITTYINEVSEKTMETLSTFELSAENMRPCSEILQEANEELAKVGASYIHIVKEMKENCDKAENLTAELTESNIEYKEMAYKDSLTELYNHRFFHEMIEKEMSRAERYLSCFTLILLDIDNFKEINDTRGHKCGDMVLVTLGKYIQQTIRQSDMGARIGGDEFAVLLPNMCHEDGEIFAEKLRAGIVPLGVEHDGANIKFTISVGVGTYHPKDGIKSKEQLIDEVDKALYNSKAEGRNRVTKV
ncbi:MAG: GGDEF domain-containing protein [Proteobacteria bacterium]|nr:GGDEF domain-containing protein [Pseudomonadota bacterium]